MEPTPLDHIATRLGQVLLDIIGHARVDGKVPYDVLSLDIDIGTPLQLVRKVGARKQYLAPAIATLQQLGLVEILPNGLWRIPDVRRLQTAVDKARRPQ